MCTAHLNVRGSWRLCGSWNQPSKLARMDYKCLSMIKCNISPSRKIKRNCVPLSQTCSSNTHMYKQRYPVIKIHTNSADSVSQACFCGKYQIAKCSVNAEGMKTNATSLLNLIFKLTL